MAGTLKVTLTAPAGRYDSGFVAVSAGGRLVETANAATLLANGGGTLTVGNLPGGRALAPAGGVPYQVGVRAWNSADPGGTLTQAAAASSVALGDSGAASISVQLP